MMRYPLAAATFCSFILLVATTAEAQVRRLPEVMPPSEVVPTEAIDPLAAADESLSPPLNVPTEPEPDRPPGARDGVFQKITFQSTWLAGGHSADAFGMTDLELKTILALPIPSRQYPLIITPAFAVHYLEGPQQPDSPPRFFDANIPFGYLGGPQQSDLPPRVYDAYTQFRWLRRISPKLGVDLAVTPGVFSDFEQGYSDALRITGYGAGVYTWSPTTKLVLGAAYLDRENVSVLPIGGIIWKPSDEISFDLLVPRSQIARRVYFAGEYTEDVQDWVYLAGEYGGGTWAIQRADGMPDTFTYSDYRVMLGVERKVIGGIGGWVECGYVFGRKIEYGSHTPNVCPPGTVMVRAGATY